MATAKLPPQAKLAELLEYDPETGSLKWKSRGANLFTAFSKRSQEQQAQRWNTRWAGQPAINSTDSRGYLIGGLFGKRVFSHRVIWELVHGEEPDQIDHINGVRTDNRLENLRNVTASTNLRNTKLRNTNKSGIAGVYFQKSCPKNPWLVSVCNRRVGRFPTFQEAANARKVAEVEVGGFTGRNWSIAQ